jgi:hypothetical protein
MAKVQELVQILILMLIQSVMLRAAACYAGESSIGAAESHCCH